MRTSRDELERMAQTMTCREIADARGTIYQSAFQLLKKYGIKAQKDDRGRPNFEPDIEEYKRNKFLHRMSINTLANHYDVSEVTIVRFERRIGLRKPSCEAILDIRNKEKKLKAMNGKRLRKNAKESLKKEIEEAWQKVWKEYGTESFI